MNLRYIIASFPIRATTVVSESDPCVGVPPTVRVLIVTMLWSALLPLWLLGQHAPELYELPEVAVEESRGLRLSLGEELGKARQALKVKLRGVQQLRAGAGLKIAAQYVRPGGQKVLAVVYRLDWLEWAIQLPVANTRSETVDPLEASLDTLDFSPLRSKVLPEDHVQKVLRSCDTRLPSTVRRPRGPFFNEPSNVRWDSRARALVLEAMAEIEPVANRCIRADVNLATGLSLCREVGCSAE